LLASFPIKTPSPLIDADLKPEECLSMSNNSSNEDLNQESLQKILKAMAGLKFGSVEITIHEGRIVQIERKEKVRLNISINESSIKTSP
jgi:hypothetical protein